MALAQLTPGDVTVAVAVQANGKVDVAQRNVPLAAHALALHGQHQIAVAGLVRPGVGTQAEPEEQADEDTGHVP